MNKSVHNSATFNAVNGIVGAILAGKYQEASRILEAAGIELPLSLRIELEAHIEFQLGRLRPESSRQRPFLWSFMVSTVGAFITTGSLRVIAIILELCGIRSFLYNHMLAKHLDSVIHYRYTNFARGLLLSQCLYHLHSRRKWRLRSTDLCPEELGRGVYLKGLVGHFWGMSGRFDLSIKTLKSAHAELNALVDRHPEHALIYLYTCEILAIRALHEAYAGHHQDASKSFDQLFVSLDQKPYWWIEVFARSMRLHTAMETINEEQLQTDAVQLKKILGAAFESKYALRTTAYAALVAAMKGYRGLALSQLLESEAFYDNTTIPIERSRYHFIRALAELEFEEFGLAGRDARIAVSNLTFVPGSRFHMAEAELLDIEVNLRIALHTSRTEHSLDIKKLKRRIRQTSKQVKGAPALTDKALGLQLLIGLVSGDGQHAMTQLPLIAGRLKEHSARFSLVLERIAGNGTGECLHRSPRLQILKDEFNYFDLMIKTLASSCDDSHLLHLMRVIFGASDCRMQKRERCQSAGISPIGQYIVLQDKNTQLTLRVVAGRHEIDFEIIEPLRSLQFDERVSKNLELALAIVQSAYLNEALIKSEKLAAVGMATQMLAHDVRKPFSLLRLTMTQMRRAASPADYQYALQKGEQFVNKALFQVEAMLKDVMEIGSPSELRHVNSSLIQLIHEVASECTQLAGDTAPAFFCHFDHLTQAKMDPPRIKRLIYNLLENAYQAAGRNGQVWLSTFEKSEKIVVTIGNSGSFIPADDLNKIFDTFYTRGKANGTGLGLAIAKKIIEDHNGKLSCKSDATNGTEFTFTLPCGAYPEIIGAKTSHSSLQTVSSSAITSRCAQKIIVLDDDPFILDAWRGSLKGANISTFNHPDGFLQEVNTGRIHMEDVLCVVTDFHFENCTVVSYVDQLVDLSVPLILSSDVTLPYEQDWFCRVIDKRSLTLAELMGLLQKFSHTQMTTASLPASKHYVSAPVTHS